MSITFGNIVSNPSTSTASRTLIPFFQPSDRHKPASRHLRDLRHVVRSRLLRHLQHRRARHQGEAPPVRLWRQTPHLLGGCLPLGHLHVRLLSHALRSHIPGIRCTGLRVRG